MGGKTVNLKLAGMLTAMAQYGLFVPAEKFTLSLFDYIYFSIGDMQSIDSGLSTFGSEISGMIEILKYSDSKGLVLIDELARGTNPEEGYALSRAIVKYLKNTDAITLFTTHFDGITSEEGIKHLRVKGLKMLDFDKLNSELIGNANGIEAVLKYMDYTLEEVDNNYEVPKDAINIARLMGLDERILHSAEKIMYEGKGDNNGKAKS
jgi:DNA mismatch repair ATPase MutS